MSTLYGFEGVGASKSAIQALTTGTEAAVTFDVENIDTSTETGSGGSFHSNTTNPDRFYAVRDGFYEMFASIRLDTITTAGRVYIGYKLNGGATVIMNEDVTTATSSSRTLLGYKLFKLVKGDYVQVYAFQSATASVNIVTASTEVVFKVL